MQQQIDWRTALQFAGVGFVIVFVLWIAGFIGSFWAGLGVLAVGHMFVAAAYIPKWRRTTIWVLAIWTLVVIVKPIVWNSLPAMVQDALSYRGGTESTRFSETFRGHGGDAIEQLALYCSKTEQQYTNEVIATRQELGGLRLDDPNRPAKEAELQQKVRNVEAWRKNCTKDFQYEGESVQTALVAFFSAVGSAFHPDNSKEWYDLLGILLLVGFGLFIAKWKGPWTKSLGGAMLLAFLFFFGRYVLFETSLTKPIQEGWAEATRELTPEEKEARRKRAEQARELAAATASTPKPECTQIQREDSVLSGTKAISTMVVASGCSEIYFEQHDYGGVVKIEKNPCGEGGKMPFFQKVRGSPWLSGYLGGREWASLDPAGTRIEWKGFVEIKKSQFSPVPAVTKLSCVS